MQGITTPQIYWGAIPFVCIQLIMVAIVIAFPQLVLGGLDTAKKFDPSTIQIEVPQQEEDLPPPTFR